MDGSFLIDRLSIWVPLLLSLTVHEWAHAYSAFRLGDDTAARQNRLTLNPLSHIDPIGTVLLPLLGIPFGWAKPVPVNPARFSRKVTLRMGMVITAAAGPASNVVLAVLCTLALGLMARFAPQVLMEQEAVVTLLRYGIIINIMLALFNMLPIPPLDGSRVADGLMPARWEPAWQKFMQYGPLLLLAVIVIVANVSILSWPIGIARDMASSAILWMSS